MLAICLLVVRAYYLDQPLLEPAEVICTKSALRLVDTPSGALPETDQRWEQVTLPNDWLQKGYTRQHEWYRYDVVLNVPPNRLWGVLLEAVNLNAAVYLNGNLVGLNGRMDEPITHNFIHPLLFVIPNGLLQSGKNTVLIHVASFPPGHGFLGKFCLGPQQVLSQGRDKQLLFNLEIAKHISALSGVFAIVIFIMWLLRRQDSQYGWLAATLIFWSLHSLKFHVANVPISSLFWAWMLYATSIAASFSTYFFLFRFRDVRFERLDRIVYSLWFVSTLSITILMLAQSLAFYRAAEIFFGISFLFLLYALSGVMSQAWRHYNLESFWLTVTVSFVVVVVVYDNLLITGVMQRAGGQLSFLAAPVLLGAFAFLVVRRFVNAIIEREELLRDLETRAIAGAARIVDLEKESALSEQRETIMRDMHDGVGGHLVSVLAALDTPNVSADIVKEVVHRALIDLRLMIDSLDIDARDLGILIGALRDRMQPILKSGGFNVSWRIGETPLLHNMTPHASLQVIRILQEALTNAIKHSGAGNITVRLFYDTKLSMHILEIEDDGQGMTNPTSGGYGLTNMRRRARSGIYHSQREYRHQGSVVDIAYRGGKILIPAAQPDIH